MTGRKASGGRGGGGRVARRRGAGTFVTRPRVEKSVSKLTSFSQDMVSRGRKPHSRWVSKTAGAVTPEEALSLGLSPGSRVYRFHRIRYAEDLTMTPEYATIPAYDRKSDMEEKRGNVRVDHGGRRTINKNKIKKKY